MADHEQQMDVSGGSDFYGNFGNSILYRMCAENPKHTDADVVHGKLWLIGRSYAASIERKAKTGFKVKHAAMNLVASEIDEKINEIACIGRVDEYNIEKILHAHRYLIERFKNLTDLENRSLASKYLHFHARNAVFIYDSVVTRRLGQELKLHGSHRIDFPRGYDDMYAAFACRCLHYRDHILEPSLKKEVTPREMDKHLYSNKAC